AGYQVTIPFPRLTYAEAMRSYGSDKPDRRVPPMHSVQDLFPENQLSAHGLPLVAIHIPKTGALSRKERDELKAYGTERGLRVFDDAKRLERDYPDAMAKVRERTGAAEEDLLLLACWAGEPKGHRPEATVYQACGPLRLLGAWSSRVVLIAAPCSRRYLRRWDLRRRRRIVASACCWMRSNTALLRAVAYRWASIGW